MRSRTLAIVSLLACGLVLGGSLWVVRTVARRSEPGPYGGEEQAGPWYFLGDEDYQVVTLVDGRPVLFNELREVDMMTISDHVTELLKTREGVNPWWERVEESQSRPDIVPPVRFYTVSERNQLIPVPRAVFSLVREEGSTVKLSRLTVSGKSILVAADPASGYSSTGVWSLPGGRFLLPGRETFWLVEPGQEVGRRVSATEYDGKTIGELREEFRALRGPDNPAGFHWYWNPILSPDGNNVAFVTDRDCLAGGDSVWVNHLPSGEEYPLIRNAAGADEYYRIDGWVDDGHLFITRFGESTRRYHLLALTGELTPLHLEGEHPGIARVGPRGMIAYRPDVVTHFPKDLYIARVDTAAKSVSTVLHIRMQGSLCLTRGNCAPISPGGSRVAYINAVDDGTPWGTRILFAVDLDGHRETVITSPVAGTVVYDFDWIGDDRLLIRTREWGGEKRVREISSWIYDLRGGRSGWPGASPRLPPCCCCCSVIIVTHSPASRTIPSSCLTAGWWKPG